MTANAGRKLNGLFASIVLGFALLVSPIAAAQGDVLLPLPKPDVDSTVESGDKDPLESILDGPPRPALTTTVTPYAPSTLPDAGPFSEFGDEGALYLVAKLTEDGKPLSRGVAWRVYSEPGEGDGKLEMVASAAGGDAEFRLDPGSYLVHTAYGHAGTTSRITVTKGVDSRTIILSAGGLRLDAELSDHLPIDSGTVSFDIYETEFDARGERKIVASNVRPGEIVRLNADTYHVVSRYGSVNAVVRADMRVEPGKLTEATVYHNAAMITLKLVKEEGGEALANTSWSVLTPGGDAVVEATGAFPSFVLASGEYHVVARNNNTNYSRIFNVETGLDREVEVIASKGIGELSDSSLGR